MESEAESFTLFKKLSPDQVADIKEEIDSLWEIKDVIDELNIMTVLFQNQKGVFKALDNLVWAIDVDQHLFLESNVKNEIDEQRHKVNESEDAVQSPGPEVFSDELVTFSEPKNEKAESKRDSEFHGFHHSTKTASIWRHRGESRAPSLPIEWVNTSIDDIKGMMDRANTVQRDVSVL